MPVSRSIIEKNLNRIRRDIAAACQRSGRYPEEVSVVAVTKEVDMETVKTLPTLGLTDLGENRIQQLADRAAEMAAFVKQGPGRPTRPVKWHMVGHLQRNKVKAALDAAEVIHSVDSLRLTEEINNRAERQGRAADIFLQINCSQEPQKHGVAVGAAMVLGELISSMRWVRFLGLMTMAPLADDPEEARPTFTRLRELFEEMRHERIGGESFRHLSMGMSQDYAVAVEEGATVLRIGTALFKQTERSET